MPQLLCIFITLIVGLVILCLLYWVLNMALGLLPDPQPPKLALAIRVLAALVVVCMLVWWLMSGMPCLIGPR